MLKNVHASEVMTNKSGNTRNIDDNKNSSYQNKSPMGLASIILNESLINKSISIIPEIDNVEYSRNSRSGRFVKFAQTPSKKNNQSIDQNLNAQIMFEKMLNPIKSQTFTYENIGVNMEKDICQVPLNIDKVSAIEVNSTSSLNDINKNEICDSIFVQSCKKSSKAKSDKVKHPACLIEKHYAIDFSNPFDALDYMNSNINCESITKFQQNVNCGLVDINCNKETYSLTKYNINFTNIITSKLFKTPKIKEINENQDEKSKLLNALIQKHPTDKVLCQMFLYKILTFFYGIENFLKTIIFYLL